MFRESNTKALFIEIQVSRMSEQAQVLLCRCRLERNSTERSKSILDSPKSVLYILRGIPSLDAPWETAGLNPGRSTGTAPPKENAMCCRCAMVRHCCLLG